MTHDRGSSPTNHRRYLARGLALALLLGAAVIVGIKTFASPPAGPIPIADKTPAVATPAAAAPGTQATPSLAPLIAAVRPAVVSVRVEFQQAAGESGGNSMDRSFQFGPRGAPQDNRSGLVAAEGSGFFISPDGFAVTNDHVVDHARSVEVVTDDGSTYKARVIGTDPQTDLAVIKVDARQPFAYVGFADSAPQVGDWVVAVGNPFGLGNTATAGIVSALDREVGTSAYDNYMQIDAPINEGNSGGPTFNLNGSVVGINSVILTPSGGSVGIGFDIPAGTAKSVTKALLKSGHVTRGWLGVQTQDVSPAIAANLGIKQTTGAVVVQTESHGPAARAGVLSGDVITGVNGMSTKDARDLAQEIAALPPGTSVRLDLLRHTQPKRLTVTLATMPTPQAPQA